MSAVTPSIPSSPPPQPFMPSFTPIVQPRELPRQRLPESFNLVTPLAVAFSLRSDSSVSLYRARMENRNVVLRVLNGEKLEFCVRVVGLRFLPGSLISLSFLPLYRLCWCHRETQLPGLRILPGTARPTSLPARASWCRVTSSSSGHSRWRAGEQRPAQLPVAMQTGIYCVHIYIYIYRGWCTAATCVNSF